jgi:hypothetical protein
MARLVPPANAVALSEAILNLAADPPLMARLGNTARAVYERLYTENRMLRSYKQLYIDLLRTKCPAEETASVQGYNWGLAGTHESLSATRQPKGGGL